MFAFCTYRGAFFDAFTIGNSYVSVQVIDPIIGLDPRGTGEWPPHIYVNNNNPSLPHLCLYDPAETRWTPEYYIAETIIPWTVDWLFFFEGWLATGKWEGGGRHPQPTSGASPTPTAVFDPEKATLKARALNAEFYRIGRKTGTFASLPLLAAAALEERFPPHYWTGWDHPSPREALARDMPVTAPPANTMTPRPSPAVSTLLVDTSRQPHMQVGPGGARTASVLCDTHDRGRNA